MEPIVEPIVESVMEPIVEPIVESVMEPIVEPLVESILPVHPVVCPVEEVEKRVEHRPQKVLHPRSVFTTLEASKSSPSSSV